MSANVKEGHDSHTPGRSWNDPPDLGFTECNGSSTKRHLLNKRVPFDFNLHIQTDIGNKNCCDSTRIVTIPQLPTATLLKENSSINEAIQKTSEENPGVVPSDEEILSIVTSTFQQILLEHAVNYKKNHNEINQRLNIMKMSWNTKISKQVKHRMFQMAQELSSGNADAAMKIHRSLMVENVREVKQWMVGVKHIIEMTMENQDSTSPVSNKDESNG